MLQDNRDLSAGGFLRRVPDPFGLYFRARNKDKSVISELLSQSTTNFSGLVSDPISAARDREIREAVRKLNLDVVLDPCTQQLAYQGSFSKAMGALAWGSSKAQTWEDYVGGNGRRRMAALAKFAIENGFTDVLSPSHVVRSADDPWLNIDPDLVKRLRDELDRQGGSKIAIIGNLALSYAVFRDPAQREEIIRLVHDLPVSQVWLKIDGLGGGSITPTAVLNYVEAACEFHELNLPVLADHMGATPGLSLLAVGAVTGLVHGVTLAERFNTAAWSRPKSKKAFSPHHRVYIPGLDLLLPIDTAEAFFDISPKVKAYFVCHDRDCCERGFTDMLQKPGKHFLFQRMKEISNLRRIPDSVRTQEYLDGALREVTDNLIRATNLKINDRALSKKLMLQRKRLDGMRVSLTRLLQKRTSVSVAPTLPTRKSREARI